MAFSEWLQQTPGAFDLLKLDCEGAEWEIVRKTSRSELARFGAVVAEVHDDPEKSQTVKEFPALMEAAGFRTVPSAPGLYLGVRRQPAAAS